MPLSYTSNIILYGLEHLNRHVWNNELYGLREINEQSLCHWPLAVQVKSTDRLIVMWLINLNSDAMFYILTP